jgi:hypothetical protein
MGLAISVIWFYAPPDEEAVVGQHQSIRAVEIAGFAPGRSRQEVEAWIRASDAAKAADPTLDADEVARRIAAFPVSEAEIRAYHAQHPEVFGDRPLAECAEAIAKLLRIEGVLRELDPTWTPNRSLYERPP